MRPHRARGPEGVGVEADARADAAALAAAVAEVHRDRGVRVAGRIQAGASALRPSTSISTRSPLAIPSRPAIAGPRYAALSQVIFDSGFGSSWSQPLLAKRPSWIVGSDETTAPRGPRRSRAQAKRSAGSRRPPGGRAGLESDAFAAGPCPGRRRREATVARRIRSRPPAVLVRQESRRMSCPVRGGHRGRSTESRAPTCRHTGAR